ncbi:type I-A CRISPR-associated protein Cas5a [Pyrolobus fumarii]|nr:type I-A CRISPR-associated protein Cas5a [Pyrolobus fumarii]
MPAVAVVAVVEAVWGWSVRVPGASVGGGSLPLPPPTTVIGSLAYSLARLLGWPETLYETDTVGVAAYSSARRLASAVLSASAGLLEGRVVTAYDVVRTVNIPFIRPENRRDTSQWLSVNAFGVTIAPRARLCMAIVFDGERLESLGINESLLEKAAWSISRLGSKEGLVSVVEAGVFRAERGAGPTRLYGRRGVLQGEHIVALRAWSPWSDESWMGLQRRGAELLELEAPLRITGPVYEPTPEPPVAIEGWRVEASGLLGECGTIPVLA